MQAHVTGRVHALSTPCMRALIPEMVSRWRPNSARVSYAWLHGTRVRGTCLSERLERAWRCDETYARMSSVMRCELSMCPRSARRASAAEDLYALRDGFRLAHTVTPAEGPLTRCHFEHHLAGWLDPVLFGHLSAKARVSSVLCMTTPVPCSGLQLDAVYMHRQNQGLSNPRSRLNSSAAVVEMRSSRMSNGSSAVKVA